MNTLINFAVKTIAGIFHIKFDAAKTKTVGAGLASIATGIGVISDLLQKGDTNIMNYVTGAGFVLAGIGTIFVRDAIKKLGDKLDGNAALKAEITKKDELLSAATDALKNVPVTDETQEIVVSK
jgi:hypothetical protein